MANGSRTANKAEDAREGAGLRTARRRVRDWAKEHRRGIAAAGIGIAATAIAAVGFGKLGASGTFSGLPHPRPAAGSQVAARNISAVTLRDSGSTKAPHNVIAHVRNLPAGRSASAAKMAEAAAKGIDLRPGQTLVSAYSTGARAA